MWLSFSTPQFREWYETLFAWVEEAGTEGREVPPVNINDLADTKLFTPEDLNGGVYLVANVWNGSRESEVFVAFDGGAQIPLARTQEGNGEAVREGVD